MKNRINNAGIARYLTRIGLFLFSAVVLWACAAPPAETNEVLSEATQSMKNATITHSDSGVLKMVMKGTEVLFFDDDEKTQEFKEGVHVTFYSPEGKVNMVITAKEATNHQKSKLMNLRKNVIIKDFRNGNTTYTEDFFWNQETRRIYSKVPVLQVGPTGNRTRGTGFESDDEMHDFVITNPRLDFTIQ